MLEAHYFPLSVALLQRPLQSYILAISLSQKQLRYLHHEQCVHAIPFSRIIRISPYAAHATTPSPSHHSQRSASSSVSSHSDSAAACALDPASSSSASPSLSLTLHVVGSRVGDTAHIHHHAHSAAMRDGLLALLLATVTPDSPPLLPSFYPLSLAPLHASPATKRGKWGTDAQRWMALLDGGRLLLFRREPAGASDEPLNCIMLSEVDSIENKGNRKLRLRDSEREWELGVESEAERDEWLRLVRAQREAVLLRAEGWQQEWRDKRAEEEARRERQYQEEASRKQMQEDEQRSSASTAASTPTASATPHSLLRLTPDRAKRRTMPAPAFFVNAQVMAARNKRGSLSIKTRTLQQQPGGAGQQPGSGLRSASGSEREESKTGGFSVESSGHVSPAISPWSAVTPRLGAQQLPPSLSMLRASTAATLSQPPASLSAQHSRYGLQGGSPSPSMAFSGAPLPPPSPLMGDDKQRSGGSGCGSGSSSGVMTLGTSVRVLDESSTGMRRSSMTTW